MRCSVLNTNGATTRGLCRDRAQVLALNVDPAAVASWQGIFASIIHAYPRDPLLVLPSMTSLSACAITFWLPSARTCLKRELVLHAVWSLPLTPLPGNSTYEDEIQRLRMALHEVETRRDEAEGWLCRRHWPDQWQHRSSSGQQKGMLFRSPTMFTVSWRT